MFTYLRLYFPRLSFMSLAARAILILALGCPGLLAVAAAPVQAAASAGPAYATPYANGQLATDPLRSLILKLCSDLVSLLAFCAGVVLTISVAKGLLDAQVSTLVGNPMGVSHAQLNLISAVVLGVLTLMSPLLVNAIFNALSGVTASVDITVPAPTVLLH